MKSSHCHYLIGLAKIKHVAVGRAFSVTMICNRRVADVTYFTYAGLFLGTLCLKHSNKPSHYLKVN
jgi:hypothetical protein